MVQNNNNNLMVYLDIYYNIIFHRLNIHGNYRTIIHILFHKEIRKNIHNYPNRNNYDPHHSKDIYPLNCKMNTLYYQKMILDIHLYRFTFQYKHVYYRYPYTTYIHFLYSYLYNFHNINHSIYNLMLMVCKLHNQDILDLFMVHNHQYNSHLLIIMYILLKLKIMYQLHIYHNIYHQMYHVTYIFSILLLFHLLCNNFSDQIPYF